jgi:5'-3' exoribonuclease 1
VQGVVVNKEERFDSNCITPGTDFMHRLNQYLQYFVHKKVSEDATWQKVEVVLSGHDVPGEGEHKIMDFIRARKMTKDYNPHTRHCLYGLDADLVCVVLCYAEFCVVLC